MGFAPGVPQSGDGVSRQAVLYARVSSKEQQQEWFSIPAQQNLPTCWSQSHSGRMAEWTNESKSIPRSVGGNPVFAALASWSRTSLG